MKTKILLSILLIVFIVTVGGVFLYNRLSLSPGQEETVEAIYTCPMHPTVRSNKPGACPVCGMALVKKTSDSPLIPDSSFHGIALSSTQRVLANIATVPVKRGTITSDIRLSGLVSYAEPLQASVAARFRGRVEALYADYTGKDVSAGDPLFDLYSPDLISAQREFLLATEHVDRKTSGGSGLLDTEGLNAQLREAGTEKLRVHYGLTDEQIEELHRTRTVRTALTFHAPISGTITRKSVARGQYVDEGMVLYELADLSVVWISFDVYEKDLRFVSKGQVLTVTSESYPGEKMNGKVTFIDPVLDPATRTVRVRTEAPNPKGKLKPNMLVSGSLKKTTAEVLVVPTSALVSLGGKVLVWVEVGTNAFEPRDVRAGLQNESFTEVLEGLSEGDIVVSSGGFLLDSESTLQSGASVDAHQDHAGRMEQKTTTPAEIMIRVSGGYSPNVIHLHRGVSTRLLFVREDSSACTDEVVIPELGVRARLPHGTTTKLEVTPERAGEFTFSCGMSMLHGKILVHEKGDTTHD